MSDISTAWNTSGTSGDWILVGADLQKGDDLVTAVVISLFTDRLSHEDDKIMDGSDPRGWIGDLGSDVLIGSRFWLLRRSKLTKAVGPKAKDMAIEALRWLIDDGIVAKFDIVTEVILPNRLDTQVTAHKQDGTKKAMNFSSAWVGVGN